jgi:5-methylcytosine-specific restriction endonuclease McrA
MTLLRPCIVCGEPADGSRCPDHVRPSSPKVSAAARGYGAAWQRLSAKARKLQPFCTDCGTSENLQLDHLPSAWERKAKGQRIRLGIDAEVVCGPCNRSRGAARPTAAQQTPSRYQQTRPSRDPWGMTPPEGRKDPRSEAKSELHADFRASGLRPANGNVLPAKAAVA